MAASAKLSVASFLPVAASANSFTSSARSATFLPDTFSRSLICAMALAAGTMKGYLVSLSPARTGARKTIVNRSGRMSFL